MKTIREMMNLVNSSPLNENMGRGIKDATGTYGKMIQIFKKKVENETPINKKEMTALWNKHGQRLLESTTKVLSKQCPGTVIGAGMKPIRWTTFNVNESKDTYNGKVEIVFYFNEEADITKNRIFLDKKTGGDATTFKLDGKSYKDKIFGKESKNRVAVTFELKFWVKK